MTCRWTSSTTPRALAFRHVAEFVHDQAHIERCPGCLPCPDEHCGCCGRNHVDPDVRPVQLNCASCIGSNRADLADLATLHGALADQAITHATATIPGGEALVLLGPASSGISQQWADEVADRMQEWTGVRPDTSHKADEFGTPVPPLLLLATWVEAWHDVLGSDDAPAHRATVETEVAWLSEHLHEFAQHLAFPQFVGEVRAARSGLESVLLAGKRDFVGRVRCLSEDCGALLRQTYNDPKPCRHDHPAKAHAVMIRSYGLPVWHSEVLAALDPCGRCDQGGRRDAWTCPACHREYDDEAYRLAKRQANDERRPIRAGVDIARDLGISAALLRQWITRKHLVRHGTDKRGRVLLDVNEVRRHAMQSGLVP